MKRDKGRGVGESQRRRKGNAVKNEAIWAERGEIKRNESTENEAMKRSTEEENCK